MKVKRASKGSLGGKHIAIERGLWPTWSGWPFRRERRRLGLPTAGNARTLSALLREAVTQVQDATIMATEAVCLEVAEDEAERCRSVGASAAQQTALTVAARIRKRYVPV